MVHLFPLALLAAVILTAASLLTHAAPPGSPVLPATPAGMLAAVPLNPPPLVVGAPHYKADVGGFPQPLGKLYSFSPLIGTALLNLTGSWPDNLGKKVAVVGDVDHDGYSDILAKTDALNPVFPDTVRVYSGKNGSVIHTFVSPPVFNSFFGDAIAWAGDADQDGWDDLAIGDTTPPGGSGIKVAHVFSGKNFSLIHTYQGPADFGRSLASAGDVDNDTYPDLLVGGIGYAELFSGKTHALLMHLNLSPALVGSDFGRTVSRAGDVNNDGVPDLIIGATLVKNGSVVVTWPNGTMLPQGNETGGAFVYSGADSSLLHSWLGSWWDQKFGWSVSGLGDVDSDGFDDVAVGVPSFPGANATILANPYADNPSFGAVHVYSGRTGQLLWAVVGNASSRLGHSVSGAGDVNNDDIPDVLVGAPGQSIPFGAPGQYSITTLGEAFVLDGRNGRKVYGWQGEQLGSSLGWSISGKW